MPAGSATSARRRPVAPHLRYDVWHEPDPARPRHRVLAARSTTTAAWSRTTWPPTRSLPSSRWLEAARIAGLHEPNAMVVSTAGSGGAPSSRMVLLKTVDAARLRLLHQPRLPQGRRAERQPELLPAVPVAPARAPGPDRGHGVSVVDDDEADEYFASRPRGSQLGAWASPQSEVVSGRELPRRRYAKVSDRFDGVDDVPRPPHWGGFLVRPHTDGVLAGPARSDARPDPVRPRSTRPPGSWSASRPDLPSSSRPGKNGMLRTVRRH